MSKWKWKWMILSFDIPVSRLFRNTSDAALWQHIVFMCRMITGFELLTPSSSGFGKQFDLPWNSLHTETISTAPVLFCETWHPWLNLWSWCWDSFSSRAYLPSSPYVQSNCLDAHLARGHSTTSGDNAATVFQYLSISETCVNQGALYINWLSPSLINEDPGAHCFDETPSGIFSSWIHSLSGTIIHFVVAPNLHSISAGYNSLIHGECTLRDWAFKCGSTTYWPLIPKEMMSQRRIKVNELRDFWTLKHT